MQGILMKIIGKSGVEYWYLMQWVQERIVDSLKVCLFYKKDLGIFF